jgi:hypothetical protein
MFIAPDAPAPIAIQKTAITSKMGLISPGARYKPTNPVKTTRDITLGFNNEAKSSNGVQTVLAGLDAGFVTKSASDTVVAPVFP